MPSNAPEMHPREKTGFRYMIIGFALMLLAGIFYYLVTEHRSIGHVLFFGGIAVYVAGRVLRSQGRSRRERGEKQ